MHPAASASDAGTIGVFGGAVTSDDEAPIQVVRDALEPYWQSLASSRAVLGDFSRLTTQEGNMSRIFGFAVAATAAAVLAAAASADSVYHTTVVPLMPTGGAPGGGSVVNIHANGPTVYAHELYRLEHAMSGSYQVTIHIYANTTCADSPIAEIPTATLDTNAVGNGEADVKFTPADADGLRGLTVSAIWTVEGPATYATDCSVITLD
jgi:hypothetical protein